MSYELSRKTNPLLAAGLVALMAGPLAACSDRPEAPESAQPDTQQMVREKEAERRPGTEEPELKSSDVDYTDTYSEPRESWTGGATASDAGFVSSEQSDAQAERMLREELAGRDGFRTINIDVQDGVAHLQGEVDSVVQHREAETIAMAMEEVVEVRNDLRIASRSD